jgi:hypothetical protein
MENLSFPRLEKAKKTEGLCCVDLKEILALGSGLQLKHALIWLHRGGMVMEGLAINLNRQGEFRRVIPMFKFFNPQEFSVPQRLVKWPLT